jgi:hypothetical protein
MMERIHSLGGWMDISGTPKGDEDGAQHSVGTTLMISIPLHLQEHPMFTSPKDTQPHAGTE